MWCMVVDLTWSDRLVFCSCLIWLRLVPKCTATLNEHRAVVRCSTAGTECMLGCHLRTPCYPLGWLLVSLYGWFPLLSATLPSHQICWSIGSNLWDLSLLFASEDSLCFIFIFLPCDNLSFPLESSSRIEIEELFICQSCSVSLLLNVSSFIKVTSSDLMSQSVQHSSSVCLYPSSLSRSLSSSFTVFLRLQNMKRWRREEYWIINTPPPPKYTHTHAPMYVHTITPLHVLVFSLIFHIFISL